MVMYKNVNGQQIEMSAQEEQAHLDASAAAQVIMDSHIAYENWEDATPAPPRISHCFAKILDALVSESVPDPADVSDMRDFIAHMAAEPSQPEQF